MKGLHFPLMRDTIIKRLRDGCISGSYESFNMDFIFGAAGRNNTMREEYVRKKIDQLLQEYNWSLYQLSKEADISYATLSNSFNRKKVPSVPVIMRICEGFHISVAEFFNEGGTLMQQLTAKDQRLIADFHRLSKNDRKLVTAYMQGILHKSKPVPKKCH